jgi:predicted nucleic acid-binding protein
MKPVFIDTSGFYAALDPGDPNHGGAISLFIRAEAENWRLVTHNYAVQETGALLQARLGWEAVDEWQQVLLPRCEIVWVDQGLHTIASARCRQARQRRLGLTDCVSLELAYRENIRDVLAYDRHFFAAGLHLPANAI